MPQGRGRPSKEQQEARAKALLSLYLKARDQFVARVEAQQGTLRAVEEGRRFDKVVDAKGHALFFIERETGTIYGVKSDLAPNFRHWFDTVYTAKNWDWAGPFPEPRKMDGYEEVRGYGEYRHFRAKKGPGRPRKTA
jgi:hypothetical protein